MFLSNAIRNSILLAKERQSSKSCFIPMKFSKQRLQDSWTISYKAPKTKKEIDAEWGPPNEPNI